MSDNVVAYSYRVVPNKPKWADKKPAFDPFQQVSFKHPDKRFGGMDGVEVENVIELIENNS